MMCDTCTNRIYCENEEKQMCIANDYDRYDDDDDYGEAEIGVLIDDPELYRILPSEDDIRFNYGDTATVCSLRQFHYYREVIEEDYCEYITLPHDTFIYCSNPEYAPHMYMVFINQKFLPDSYVISFPQLDSPVYENRVYFNTPVRQGNVVEVFLSRISYGVLQLVLMQQERIISS